MTNVTKVYIVLLCIHLGATTDIETGLSSRAKNILEVPGIEPGAFRMQSEHSTTELHPHL